MLKPADFSSWSRFTKACEARQGDVVEQEGETRWSNHDLDPTPPRQRTWTALTFFSFWASFAASSGHWTSASSLIALGLNPIPTFGALLGAHYILAGFIVMNGRGPSRYHIGFPVFARAAYGLFFCGTTSYYGAQFTSIAITCIWPRWETLPNALPKSAGITSTKLASFFIYYAVMVPISFVHSRKLKWWYTIKAWVVLAMMHFMLIWWMVKAHPLNLSVWPKKAMTSRDHAWLIVQAINAGIGSASSITVNQGDMARYARKPSDQMWTTFIGYPIVAALPNLYGILVATATKQITGTSIWNMWDTLDYMLKQYPPDSAANRGMRFLCFLTAAAMAASYMGVNIATNCLPFGSDLSAFFPKYMTIRRGQVLCCFLGLCTVPWKLITGAPSFITFTSAYGYWLSPLAATMAIHYFIIAKGNIDVPELYKPGGKYWYTGGVNLRAPLICAMCLIPVMPGFCYQVNNHLKISYIGRKIYNIGFLFTWFMCAFLIWLSYKIWPDKTGVKMDRWEGLADENDAEEKRAFDRESGAETPSIDDEKKVGEPKTTVVSI
ncbi:hypothetical protein T439DRAFT_354383 [Meredithblackwellia eburnea MCA 4105]